MRIGDMTIGFVGNGSVGKALGRAYCEHVKEVRFYDKIECRSSHHLEEVLDSNLIFVCLPTPRSDDGYSCNTTILVNFFFSVLHKKDRNFVLKSTVPVGFTEWLVEGYKFDNLVHCPEFLTARTAFYDACNPARNIIGIPLVRMNRCGHLLNEFLYQRHPGSPVIITGSNESELVKLGTNGAYAHKVCYFNELKKVSDAKKLDWEVVRAGIISDGRVGESHTQVPGHDSLPGFGGQCLEKDLSNLVHCAHSLGVDLQVSKSVLETNSEDRRSAYRKGKE